METKRRSRFLMIVVLVVVGALAVFFVYYRQAPSGEGSPPPSESPEEAAKQGLVTLSKIITEENYEVMGFQSVEEASAANLGKPLEVFYVPLNQLQDYQPQSEPEGLLANSGRIIYPVTVKEQVRSSIVVSGTDANWRATEFGGSKLMLALAEVRVEGESFIVTVPALNLYFIANQSEDRLVLTPIIDDDRFDFIAGESLSAAEVFERILPAAREHEDLPTGG